MGQAPSFTGKVFTVGDQSYFYNSSAGQTTPLDSDVAANFAALGNRHGGCDLPRADPGAPDLRPYIANPFTPGMIERATRTNLRLLVLEMTQKCNLACSYCIDGDAYQQKNCISQVNMSRETALRGVDLLLDNSSRQKHPLAISFYGGEPLLRFDLIREVVAHARARATVPVFFSITTNGTLLDDEKVDFLIAHDFQVVVSMDGPREIHDTFRLTKKGAPTYDRIVRALARIRNRAPAFFQDNLRVSIVVMPDAPLQRLQEFFDDLDVKVLANFVESYGLAGCEAGRGSNPHLRELAQGLRARMAAHKGRYLDSPAAHKDFAASLLRSVLGMMEGGGKTCGGLSLGQCLLGTSRLFLSADGALYPCEKTANNSVARIGTAKDGIDTQRVAAILEDFYAMAKPKCDGCWASPRCSMCLALCASGDAISPKKFDYYCEGMKSAGEFALKSSRMPQDAARAAAPLAAE